MTPQRPEAVGSPSITQDDDPYMNHDNIYNPKALQFCPNNNPLISFAGHQWWTNFHWSDATGCYVWGGDDPTQPQFGTYFDPYLAPASTDGSTATLQIQPPNTASGQSWRTSELCLMDNVGYGQYLITAKADEPADFAAFDPNVVFGIFTYQFTAADSSEGPNIHRELDVLEVLRRFPPGDNTPGDAQFMLQPWNSEPPGKYFIIPPNTPVITVVLSWNIDAASGKKYAYFGLWLADYDWTGISNNQPFQMLQAAGTDFEDHIPSHQWERFHLNLWLMHGVPPAGSHQVRITRFLFKSYSP
jgi:hypothetical protein